MYSDFCCLLYCHAMALVYREDFLKKQWLNIFPNKSICLVSFACLLGLRFLMPTPNARKEETVTQQILWDFFKSMMIPCVRKRRRKTHQVYVPLPPSSSHIACVQV